MANFITWLATLYFELKCCQLSIRKESFNLEIRVVDHIYLIVGDNRIYLLSFKAIREYFLRKNPRPIPSKYGYYRDQRTLTLITHIVAL